jgi:SAM-dependent methyltransferase
MHAMWGSVAGSWADHADFVDARATAITAAMLDRSQPQRGERVLELACGPGGVGLEAATRVGTAGQVVLSDVSAEMTAIAARRAAARGLVNITTRVLDLEEIDEPDASYDVVLCREGLMFAADPLRAGREIHRVLRPNGRVALAVWGPRARNPWLAVVLDAVSAAMGAPVPPPGIPGPFSLDDPDLLAGVLGRAGLVDVQVDELEAPMRSQSFDDWWTRTSSLAGPVANLLAALPDDAAQALRTRVQEATREYTTPDGLEFPGVTLLAAARRPSQH